MFAASGGGATGARLAVLELAVTEQPLPGQGSQMLAEGHGVIVLTEVETVL
jgi:hypothetical protein